MVHRPILHRSSIGQGAAAVDYADLPRTERRELIDGVREHLEEAQAELPEQSDAALLNLLDRLGDPALLAEEERERLGLRGPNAPRVGWLEISALVLTPLVWPIGIILLWTSTSWNVRHKLIGTLVPPGGLFTSLLVITITATAAVQVCSGGYSNGHQIATTCSGGLHGIGGILITILLLLDIVSPIPTGIYLGVHLRRRTRFPATGTQA